MFGCLRDLPVVEAHERSSQTAPFLPATQLVGPQPFWATLAPRPLRQLVPEPADPVQHELRAILQQAPAFDSDSQVFEHLAPKFLRISQTFEGLADAYDDILPSSSREIYAWQLGHAILSSLSTKCERPLGDGWLLVQNGWVVWRPQSVPFCLKAAGMDA